VADLHLMTAGPLKSGIHRPFNKRPHKLPLVFRRTAHIRLGIGGSARGIGRRFDQFWSDLLATKRYFSLLDANR
jgi:hypothetical protein